MAEGERASSRRRAAQIGVALTVLFSLAIVIWGSSKQAEYENRAEEQASENAWHTNRDIESGCLRLPAPAKRDCAVKAHREQRHNERDEQDLVAQKTSALWTFLMGAAAVVGVMLSTVGVWLVYITFEETKRGADEARRAADETKRSVDAFMDAERARIAVIRQQHARKDGSNPQWMVPINVSNFGRSACKIVEVRWARLEDLAWHDDFRHVPSASRNVEIVVAPASDTQKGPQFVTNINVALDARYVGGFVVYDTQFQKGCRTNFLWRIGKHTESEYGADYADLEEQGGQNWPDNT